jgi:hypothetical protein
MARPEIEEMQRKLAAAFGDFKAENPQLAEALRVLNISYEEYLRVLAGLQPEPGTSSGNSHTPV